MNATFAVHVKAAKITHSAPMALMSLTLAEHRYLKRQTDWLGSEVPADAALTELSDCL